MFLYFIYSSLSPTSSYPTSLGVTDLWEKPWDVAVHLGRIPAFSDLPDPGPPPPPPPPLPRPGVGRRRSRRRRRKSRRRIEKYRKRVRRTVGWNCMKSTRSFQGQTFCPWAPEEVRERASERMSVAECASEASSVEQVSEWAVRVSRGANGPVLYESISYSFYPLCDDFTSRTRAYSIRIICDLDK